MFDKVSNFNLKPQNGRTDLSALGRGVHHLPVPVMPTTSMGTEHEKTDRCGGGGAVDLGGTVTRGPLCSLPHGSPPGVGKPAARLRQQKQTDSDTGLASRAQGQGRGTCCVAGDVAPLPLRLTGSRDEALPGRAHWGCHRRLRRRQPGL